MESNSMKTFAEYLNEGALVSEAKMPDKAYYKKLASVLKEVAAIQANRLEAISTKSPFYKEGFVSFQINGKNGTGPLPISYVRDEKNMMSKIKQSEDILRNRLGKDFFVDYKMRTVNAPLESLMGMVAPAKKEEGPVKPGFWATTVGDTRNTYIMYGAKVKDEKFEFPTKTTFARIRKNVGEKNFSHYYVNGKNNTFTSYDSLVKFIEKESRGQCKAKDIVKADELIDQAWSSGYYILQA